MKGQAKVCEFSSHVIFQWLEDTEIQKRMLSLATTEQDLGLKKVEELVCAQETGHESRKLLGGAGSLS